MSIHFKALVLRLFTATALFTASSGTYALVISPTSTEVGFSYTAEFQTQAQTDAAELIARHAQHMFGYLQNPDIVKAWNVNARTFGIGAPSWKPQFKVLEEQRFGSTRMIRYQADGILLLLKPIAKKLLRQGEFKIEMPYLLDHFYKPECSQQEPKPSLHSFWYFHNPFRQGCESLRKSPLAETVALKLTPILAPEDQPADLDGLRLSPDDRVFQIVTINGFSESWKDPKDDGRVNFQKMNKWFVDQGFEETVISRHKTRPIHEFERTLKRKDGVEIHVKVIRLLAETDLDAGNHVTFSKFFREAVIESDVIVYEGHSGSGVSMDLSAIEKRAGQGMVMMPEKRQLFFFDACSSYSYFKGMLEGRKNPGNLNVMSNGVESTFDFEIPGTKRFYNILFDVDNNSYTWNDIIRNLETPLRGSTFMLNVHLE